MCNMSVKHRENSAQKALIFKKDYIIIREVYGKNFLMQKAEGQSNGRDGKCSGRRDGRRQRAG